MHINNLLKTYINSFRYNMFKIKNKSTKVHLISLLIEQNLNVYFNNSVQSNCVTITNLNTQWFGIFKNFTETSKVMALDIVGYSNLQKKTTTIADVFYSYNWDSYFVLVSNNPRVVSVTNYFYSRFWLERELSEMFTIPYINLSDTRPLLLNYGDDQGIMKKDNTLQPNFEIRTVWHKRNIFKSTNQNVGL